MTVPRTIGVYGMFKKLCSVALIGVMLFVVSAAVPGKAFAATTDYTTEDANPSDPASVNIKQQQYAQRKSGGRGPSSGPKKTPGKSPGPKKTPGKSPGAKPSPGSGPGGNKNVNVNRNVNVTVKHRGRGWRGTRWGAVVFGVTLGTLIVVAARTPPPAPDPTLCWTWNDDAQTKGYWYYCEGP